MTARDDYPIHAVHAALDAGQTDAGDECNRMLDEIDGLRAALQLSQDARRTNR